MPNYKDGLIKISEAKINKKYIRCMKKGCKKIGFNDDDSVCPYCGSKNTLRFID